MTSEYAPHQVRMTKRPWDAEEDAELTAVVARLGAGAWSRVALEVGCGRSGKQCRERWYNHLEPGVNKGEWTTEEDLLIQEGVRLYGKRWCELVQPPSAPSDGLR